MKWFLILLYICFSFIIKGEEYYWTTLDLEQIKNFLVKTNKIIAPQGIQLTSSPYSIPSTKWIENVYYPYLKSFIATNKVSFYLSPENNCVRFSNYAVTAGYLKHFLFVDGPRKTSLAIGIVDFLKKTEEGHSINFFVATDEYKQIIIYYFEPQTQTKINPTNINQKWLALRL